MRKVDLIEVLKDVNEKVLVKFKDGEEVKINWVQRNICLNQRKYKEYMEKKEEVGTGNKRKRKKKIDQSSKRNVRMKWNDNEEQALRDGVSKFGVGSWKQIRAANETAFDKKRTAEKLKDKWRQLTKEKEKEEEQEKDGDSSEKKKKKKKNKKKTTEKEKEEEQEKDSRKK